MVCSNNERALGRSASQKCLKIRWLKTTTWNGSVIARFPNARGRWESIGNLNVELAAVGLLESSVQA
jgi:hypothetical protein